MERRRLLRAAAGVGVAGTLATAAVVADGPSLPPARRDGTAVSSPDGAPVVAAGETTRDVHPTGYVSQETTVFDLDAPRQFALLARYRLIPGQNQYSTDWRTTGLTVEHRVGGAESFAPGTVVARRSEVVPASDDSARATSLGLATDHAASRSRWRVAYDSPSGNTVDYSFLTTVAFSSEPSDGDALLATEFEAGYSGGWFSDDALGGTATISYGDGREDGEDASD